MTRRTLLVALWTAALAAVLGAGLLVLKPYGTGTAVPAIGGPFRLASARGGVVDSSDLLGKPYAVFFGFTHCPEVCPTTLYEMSGTLLALGEAARDFRVFFITVDPERDSADAMADYLVSFDPRMEALIPTADELQKLASDFRVYFARVPTSDGGYTMDHTASVFLMDARGEFAGTIAFGEAADMRQAKIRRLLEGG